MRSRILLLALATVAIGSSSSIAQPLPATAQPAALSANSWQLVKFQDGDGASTVPDDGSKYTITFASNGRVSSRVDCNRGGSTWKTSGTNELKFGSWSMSRAKCAASSLHDKIVNDGANVRYYEIKNGHLFLWGMEAGGYYELEPVRARRRS
jgi:heat shock protein HslJ